ncbi:tetratricopeptide repeat protein [Tolumonas lignilytica]|uniref:tetratricopeptide repeat protein n=1 Tax=Tolumonas lignilytica TaxID=1283284 RepID=UPI0004643916|nr:sel1 repeat family protein [Tolumonas lignilytica]
MKTIALSILMFLLIINISHAANDISSGASWYSKGLSEEKRASGMNNKLEQLGEKITEKESREFTEKVNNHYNQALTFYLKGAEEGSAISAWKAAGLGSSGMASQLSDEKIKTLILQAAKGNVIDAQMSFVLDNCNAQYTECKDSKAAVFWLKKATKNGSGVAANILGFLYEHGRLVNKNMAASISCYKLASEEGNKEAQNNINRLLKNKNYPSNNKCE